MLESDVLRDNIRTQLFCLKGLLSYLEDRDRLGTGEFFYCQTKIHQVLKQLKRIERKMEVGASDV